MEILEKLGFEDKEERIYLSLLKRGKSTASEISEDSGVERTLCYSILQKLIDKAVVSYVVENNVKYFFAAPPQKLLEDLEEKRQELKDSLPKLEELMKTKSEKASAKIYRGKEGIKTILKDIIKEKENYLVFGEEGRFQKLLPIESEQFMRKIENAKIKEKVLVRKGEKIVKSKNSQFRYVPEDYLSPTSTVVYGDKVAILIWSEPLLVVLVENKDVADSYRSYFSLLWNLKV
jgi:sugar-specific transcriptional regulator TrmB